MAEPIEDMKQYLDGILHLYDEGRTKTRLQEQFGMVEEAQRKYREAAAEIPGLEGFHFHQLRHTFTSNLLSNGAAPKDVQELLGHADVSTTMNIYAHSTREAKRSSARLLDKVVGD